MKTRTLSLRSSIALVMVLLISAPAALVAASSSEEIGDAEITLAIERELRMDPAINADPIDVRTDLGVVTLTGRTNNILAKRRADTITSGVKGVRAVVNRIQVRPAVRPDADIASDIARALARDPAADSWEIDTDVDRGAVTLSGDVDSWWEKELAEKVALRVRGVASVDNQIEVVQEERLDTEIKKDIESALQWDSRVDDGLITVEVADGSVKLLGTVGSAREKSLAASNAHVAGVRKVDTSTLEIEWWARDEMRREEILARQDDDRTRQAVLDALLFDPRVNSTNVDVEVDGGRATLTGTVMSLGARRAAAEDATNTTGVWRVHNYLKVRPIDERTDSEIAEDIRSAIESDPYLDRFDIDVYVNDGITTLSGTVDSRFEKRQADTVAANTRGVTSISNLLRVSFEPGESDLIYSDWESVPTTAYSLDPLTPIPRADWEIRQDIRQEIFWSPFVDSEDIHVVVEDGVAYLTGTVDFLSERRMAEKEAFQGGAVDVENELTVRWGPPEAKSPDSPS